MSRSTRKAIAGTQVAEERTHRACQAAVGRYETVRTPKDLLAIYAWAATQDWFLRSADDDQAMRTADRAARSRIVAPKVAAAP